MTCGAEGVARLSDSLEAKALIEPVVPRGHAPRRDYDVIDAFVGRECKLKEIHYRLVVGDVDMPERSPRRLWRLVWIRDGGPAILAPAGQSLTSSIINVADADIGGVGAAQFRKARSNAVGTT